MSVTIVPSPAEIVQAWLISQLSFLKSNELQEPGDGSTVCLVDGMADEFDQAVFIQDQVGLDFGRRQRGKTERHPGIKIIIRALDHQTGFSLANAVANALDSSTMMTVSVNGVSHYVQSIYKTSTIIRLGEEVGKRRQLWSINARIVFQDREPALG